MKTKIAGRNRAVTAIVFATTALCFASPARALEGIERDFAYCTGRLSAQIEHHWLLSLPGSERVMAQRDTMAELLYTIVAPADRRHALDLRISAKLAQSALLTKASFGKSDAEKIAAQRQAQAKINSCLSLLLS